MNDNDADNNMGTTNHTTVDAVIVGAGFAGLYTLHRLRALGLQAVVYEKGSGVGGTWYWNPYPGARCDVESFEYSYSFDPALEQQWRWSERYATQPELLAYLQHVAAHYKLLPHIRLDTTVLGASWDQQSGTWLVHSSAGTTRARFLVMATGCLSQPNVPALKGMADFSGSLFHSGQWPQQGLELEGKRVGVIGTGSSGTQIISNIAPVVQELHVFQRTPHWVIRAGNRRISDAEDSVRKQDYRAFREQLAGSLLGMGVQGGGGPALQASADERYARYQANWERGGAQFLMSYDDLLVDLDANATACAFLADKIRQLVHDPVTAAALIPDAARFPVGARRLVMDDDFHARFNQPNVTLHDTRADPIDSITATGIRQISGRHTALDIIVLATGFDALTGPLLRMDITGRDGRSLRECWAQGPSCYLGLGISGFPNLFTITGPGSPSVFSNVVLSIEQHVDFIAGLIDWMQQRQLRSAEPEADAEQQWGQRVLDVAKPTVLAQVESWYWGANVAGKPRAFLPYLGGVGTYRDECRAIVEAGYKGYTFLP